MPLSFISELHHLPQCESHPDSFDLDNLDEIWDLELMLIMFRWASMRESWSLSSMLKWVNVFCMWEGHEFWGGRWQATTAWIVPLKRYVEVLAPRPQNVTFLETWFLQSWSRSNELLRVLIKRGKCGHVLRGSEGKGYRGSWPLTSQGIPESTRSWARSEDLWRAQGSCCQFETSDLQNCETNCSKPPSTLWHFAMPALAN